ncbi:MAG: molybdate ABC transporter permease subunit [Firmicutes bacterium]|nr:molybdate ABC transporter permease subunit [Bacillota bacterium]
MDISPILISLKTAAVSIVITFFLGVYAARWVVGMRSDNLRNLVDGLFTLPLVLPPTVAGFFLLYIFGLYRPVGAFLLEKLSVKLVFNWPATVLAAVVISFPLMYRSSRAAFEQVDGDLIAAARTLGLSDRRIFWRVTMPLALPGVGSGGVLAFARGMGEFGATIMLAGNIAGRTRTLPLAIYSQVQAANFDSAWLYVAVLVAICFVVVVLMNWFAARGDRYKKRI